MRMKLSRFVSITACIFCCAGVVQASPIVNGSFEEPNLGGTWATFPAIPGWSATVGTIEIGAGGIYGVTGYDGQQVLELDSWGNAVVAQFVTTPGGTYTLAFLYAKRAGTSDASNTFEVYWNGGLVQNLAPTSTAMALYSTTVVATGNDTLSFRGTGIEDTYGGIVDNVQLNTVPDGGITLSLLAIGLIGVGCLRRKL